MADTVLTSVADGSQLNNSGQAYYLTDESGNRLTDESGNYLVADWFGGLVLTESTDTEVTAADGAQANASDAPSLVQHHVIAVSDASNANYGDGTGFDATLSVSDSAQVNNSGEKYYLVDENGNRITDESGNYIVVNWFGGLVLTENVPVGDTVTAADSSVANVADAPALTQVYVLGVYNGIQVCNGDEPSLTQAQLLASAADGTQVSAVDAPALTQAHLLTLSDGIQTNAADAPVLIIEGAISVSDGAQVNAADAPIIVQHHIISLDDGANVNTAEDPAATQCHNVASSDGSQVNTTDDVSITQAHVLAVDDGVQVNEAEDVLFNGINLDDAVQENVSDGISLTQHHVITISDGANLSASEALVVIIGHMMSPQDSGQINESAAIELIQNHSITLSDGTQPLAADDLVVEIHAQAGKPGKKTTSAHPVRNRYRQEKIYQHTYRRAGDVWRSR